jgi:hypothetical protein
MVSGVPPNFNNFTAIPGGSESRGADPAKQNCSQIVQPGLEISSDGAEVHRKGVHARRAVRGGPGAGRVPLLTSLIIGRIGRLGRRGREKRLGG